MNSGRLFPPLCLRRKSSLPGVSAAAGKRPPFFPPPLSLALLASLVAVSGFVMYLSVRQSVTYWVAIAKIDPAQAHAMLDMLAAAAAATTAVLILLAAGWIVERDRFARAGERERKRMDEQLRASEERFRQAFEHAPIGMTIHDLNGRILAANPATCRLIGYSQAELAALTLFDLTHPDDREREADWLAELAGSEDAHCVVDKRAIRKDGRIVHLSICRMLVRDAGGQPLYCISQIQDISERTEAIARIQRLSQLKAAISETNRVIVHNQAPAEVFRAVCRACIDHGCFWLAWVGVADGEAQRIVPVAIAGPAAAYLDGLSLGTSADVPEGRGPTAVAYREERVHICNDFSADPAFAPWRERARAHGLASSIALPLPRGGKPYGTLSVYGPDKDFFDAEAVALLKDMAANISFAIDQYDRETLRSSLSHRLVAVQEDERRRLAAQLHECLSPNLAAIKIMLATLSASLSEESRTPILGHIEDAQALLDDTTADVRNICAELRPTLLDYAGLIPALHGYATLVMKHTAVDVHVTTPVDGTRLDAEIESTLFRIAQEALANCARHACAKNVFIELTVSGPDVVLTIRDDGFGFDAEALERAGATSGLGLITMKERAEFAGGRFVLSAYPLKGTEIRVELIDPGRPYPDANPSRPISPQARCGWSPDRRTES